MLLESTLALLAQSVKIRDDIARPRSRFFLYTNVLIYKRKKKSEVEKIYRDGKKFLCERRKD